MLLKEQLGFWAINKTLSLRDENSWKSLRLHVAIYREMDGRRSLSIAVHLAPTQSSLLRRPQQIKVTALSSNRPVCRCSRRSNTARRLFFSWCPGFCQPPTPPKMDGGLQRATFGLRLEEVSHQAEVKCLAHSELTKQFVKKAESFCWFQEVVYISATTMPGRPRARSMRFDLNVTYRTSSRLARAPSGYIVIDSI